MTISSTVNRTSTVGDATVTAFSFPYLFFADNDLKVILVTTATGVEVVQTITTHYTITGAGVAAGGVVTMVTAPASTETLVIIREEQFTQTLDLVENDPFPSSLVEQQFDTLTMLAQQLNTDLDRSVKAPKSDSTTLDLELPASPVRANRIMAFDASGNVTTSAVDSLSLATLQAFTDYKVTTATGNGSTAAYTLIADPGQEGNTQVFLDGVYQSKSSYSLAASVLTFDTNIPSGVKIEVVHGTAAGTYVPLANTLTYEQLLQADIDTDLSSVSGSDDTLASAKAIKTYVDAQVTASDLDFAGGTGTGAVDLDSQTFTVAGTANEIETAASGQTITVGLPANVTIAGVTTHGGNVVSDTDSTDDLGTTGVRWANLYVDAITATDQVTATGFTGTLDGILGSGTPAAATVTTIDASGVATATTFEPDGDTAAGDNAAIGYTAAEGLILTGQGSTSDITLKNDADATVFTVPTGTDDILFPDNAKAMWGAGSDLQIYHNGSNTYINETGTGKLIILATDLTMADTGNAHNYLNAVSGAGVTLYYDNNSRIATTATGVTITGEAIATGFTGTLDGILGSGSASAATVTALEVTSLSGTGAVTITDILDEDNMASNSATKLSTQQSIKAYVDAQVDTVDTLAEVLAIGNTSGGTDLAISAGDDITFTDSSKALFGAGSDLQIYHDGSNSNITDAGTGDLILRASNDIFLSNVAGSSIYGRFAEGGAVSLYHNGSVKFATSATGVTITGDATATDDVKLLSDSAILSFGADSEVTLTHVHDVGLAQPAGQTIYRGAAGDFDAAFTSRNNTHGQSDFEWGHSAGGYGNTLGSHVSSGVGFICFHGGRGSSSNTYQTHGQAGCGFQDNNNRILTFFSLDTADADNQSPTTRITLNGTNGNLVVSGALSKGSGSFRITHPLESKEDTHDLVHSFIEGPQADLIYRGRVTLSGGSATVNIDTSAGMTAGTFDVLCRDVQCFTSNESGWTCVRGSVSGATLTIEAEALNCTDTISWMVVGERKDHHMIDTDWTDENGKVIVEPEKVDEEIVNIGE